MVNWIDTHCHVYDPVFDPDREACLERAWKRGVTHLLLPNVDQDTIAGLHALVDQYPGVCIPMMGLHPCSVQPDFNTVLEHMFGLFDARQYAAVGEIGIDLYWDKSTQDIQETAFHMQVDFAIQHNLPIAIHSRQATQRIITLLKQHKHPNLRGVFHCFSESLELALEIQKLGFYVGIGGVLTFKNAGLSQVLTHLPLSMMVLETDSPYLSPVPHRGKRNEPAYVDLVGQHLAQVMGVSVAEVAKVTSQNAKDLFGLTAV